MSKDYYKILEVDKNATKEEIKKAFHKLAMKYHPDKNNGDDKKFKEVNEAYQVLSDDKKRSQYDQFGTADPNMGGAYGGGFGGFDFSGFQNSQGFDMNDLGDIFGDFFGGGMSGRKARRKGRDIELGLNLSFEESIFGVSKTISIEKDTVCDICNGTGAKPGTKMSTCKECGGSGQIKEIKRSILGSFATTKTCSKCYGKGQTPSDKCNHCNGSGIAKKKEDLKIQVPAGIENGEILKMAQGGEHIQGGVPGDLYLKMKVKPDSVFYKDGINLLMNLSIKLSDSLLGSTHKFKTLDKKELEIKIPEGTKHNDLLRVRGKGVPSGAGRGDLIIKIEVKVPSKLSRKERELVEKLKEEGM
ncbi:MAG: molecular chaperone DnaJ [Candidatus Moranbacteria bacterium]|nr:molecular chaperone DnaJ [Candidatus Moranbacteria bacterium]